MTMLCTSIRFAIRSLLHGAFPCCLRAGIVILGLLLLFSACSRQPQGDPDRGRRWYSLYRCNGCHGEGGTGGRAPALSSLSLSYDRFVHKLRKPESNVMPSYEPKRLSEQDAADIYAWLTRKQMTEDR